MPLHWVGKADRSGSSIWQGGQRACLDFTHPGTQQPQEDWTGWGSLRHS